MSNKIKLSIKKEKNDKIETLKSEFKEFKEPLNLKKTNPMYIIYVIGAFLTFGWINFITNYLSNQYSINLISNMLPQELGVFLVGTITPIGFMWLLILYMKSNLNSNREKKIIYPFLQSLIEPNGDSATIINQIKQKLSTETEELKKTLTTLDELSSKILKSNNEVCDNIKISEDSIQKHKETLNEIQKDLTKSIEDIKNLKQTASSIEEKSSSITQSIIHKTEMLEETITKLQINSQDIEHSANSALQNANEVSEIFSNIGKQIITSTEIANTHSNQILDKIEEKTNLFVVKSNISAERIATASNDLISSLDTINILSNENKKLTHNSLEQITNQAQFIANKLNEQTEQFNNKTSTILTTVAHIENKFDNISATMNNISNDIISNFKDITVEINNQKDNLFKTSSEVAENIDTLSNHITNQQEGFIKSIQNVKNITIETTNSIKNSSSEIINTSDNIKLATHEINGLMEKSKINLATQAEAALKFATDIRTTLKNQINDLEEISNNISTQTTLGEISITKQGEKLSSITENIFLKIDSMNGKIASTINSVLNLASQIDEKFKSINNTILHNSSTASKILSDNIDSTIEQSNNFRLLSQDFAEKSKNTNTEINTLVNELRQLTLHLEATTHQTKDLVGNISSDIIRTSKSIPELTNSINGLEHSLSQNTENINNAIDMTKQKSKQLIENLNLIGSEFSKFANEKTAEIEYVSTNSTQAITKLATYTNQLSKELLHNLEQLNSLKPTPQEKLSTDEFLNKAGYIIEKLNETSVDLSQILTPEISGELWNKYNAGHKSVFSKYLNHTLNKKQISTLKELIARNTDFREFVQTFIKEFDNLIIKASNADKSIILLSTITSTDIGKTYMILKEII